MTAVAAANTDFVASPATNVPTPPKTSVATSAPKPTPALAPCNCSVAYAAGELFAWPTGLEHPPQKARGFYGVIAAAILLGIAVDLSPLDPIKALVWSAVVNGVIVVPVLVAMMIVASRAKQMGQFVATRTQRIFGWLTTATMAIAAVAMFATM